MKSRYRCFLCCWWWLTAGLSHAGSDAFRVGVLSAIHRPEQTYEAQLIDMALARHGYQLELISVPGKRLMSQLNRGEVDGDLIRSVDLSRGFDSILRVPEALGSSCGSVYHLQARAKFNVEEAMHNVSVAAYHGASGASSFLLRNWPAVTLEFFSLLPQGLKMLANERVELIAVHDLDRHYLEALSDRPLQLYARFNLEPNYFHVHQKYEKLVPLLSASLRELKREFPPPVCFEAGREVPPGGLIYVASSSASPLSEM
ncbi:MAG: hypothetical protein ACRBBW_10155 [Cellvibrionaceae bacterium]